MCKRVATKDGMKMTILIQLVSRKIDFVSIQDWAGV